MDKILKEQLMNHASNSMELNPDRGGITAIKDAADFHDVELTPQEIESLAFEVLFEQDENMDF